MLEQYLLSYNAANLFSAMVYFIPVFFSILAGLGAFGWSGMEKGSKEWKQKRIRVAVAVVIDILAIVVAFNGRWTRQDIDAWKEYTYFGQTKNSLPDGHGKLFDKDDRVYYIGEFHSSHITGKGKCYAYDKKTDRMFVQYEGTFKNGQNHGRVQKYAVIEGERKLLFDADFVDGKMNGQGEAYGYDEAGHKTYSYSGGYANNERWGYAELIHYDSEENIINRYRGSFTNGKMSGSGKYEYTAKDGGYYIYVGNMKSDKFEGEAALYDAAGKGVVSGEYKNDKIHKKKNLYEKYPCPDDMFWR